MIAASIGLIVGIILFLYGWWRQRHYLRLSPPMISPHLLQLAGLIIILAAGASLFSLLTGITWQPPRRGV